MHPFYQKTYTIQTANNKGADQTARMRLCCSHMAKTGFLMIWLISLCLVLELKVVN